MTAPKLAAVPGGPADPAAIDPGNDLGTAADDLGALLKLPTVGRRIVRARIVGRGSRASADIYLDNGDTISFDSLRDAANATRLTVEVVASTGATPVLKAAQAHRAVALLRALAEHEEAATADDVAFEWGGSFLREAPILDVNLVDQAERWGAFSLLKDTSPWGAAQQSGGTVAQYATVLRAANGERLIRASWFHSHVRASEHGVGAPEVAHRMMRVDWTRRGGRGRIKASHPTMTGSLAFAFFIAPENWEDR